jgi:predicted transcriptional regulator
VASGFSRKIADRGQEAAMARASWFDDRAEHPVIQEQIAKLESFTSAMADGVVEKRELDAQEQRVSAAMKNLEPELSDELHAKVTNVLVELTAYNVMRLLHELHAGRARVAFGKG